MKLNKSSLKLGNQFEFKFDLIKFYRLRDKESLRNIGQRLLNSPE